jgi:hypothetical protein
MTASSSARSSSSAGRACSRARVAALALAVLLLACAVLAVVFSGGTYGRYPRAKLVTAAERAAAPSWTRPCWAGALDDGKPDCVRVAGRVAWIQQHDPDGDGDRHLIVVARLRVHIVKLDRRLPVRRLPGLGGWVDVTGTIEDGGSGHDELKVAGYRSGATRAVEPRP